jgi:hypothetical protein
MLCPDFHMPGLRISLFHFYPGFERRNRMLFEIHGKLRFLDPGKNRLVL